jgi:hypothetical protein
LPLRAVGAGNDSQHRRARDQKAAQATTKVLQVRNLGGTQGGKPDIAAIADDYRS